MEEHPINFDSVLEEIGAFGKFQKLLYFTVCSTVIFTTGLGLSVVFSAAVPKTRCLIPNCDNLKYPQYSDAFTKGFANFTIPHGKYYLNEKYEILNFCFVNFDYN